MTVAGVAFTIWGAILINEKQFNELIYDDPELIDIGETVREMVMYRGFLYAASILAHACLVCLLFMLLRAVREMQQDRQSVAQNGAGARGSDGDYFGVRSLAQRIVEHGRH